MAFANQGFDDVVLHLPASLRDRAEAMANRESLSLNLFVLMAIAEKLQRLQLQHCLDTNEQDEVSGHGDSFPSSVVH